MREKILTALQGSPYKISFATIVKVNADSVIVNKNLDLNISGIVFKSANVPLTPEEFLEATNALDYENIPYEKYWDYYIDLYNKVRSVFGEGGKGVPCVDGDLVSI